MGKTSPSGEACGKGVDGCGGRWWAGETSPSPIDNGVVCGMKFDGRRGHSWARKTSPSGGEARGKGVDGRGGRWWARETLPNPIDNGVMRGKDVDGHR